MSSFSNSPRADRALNYFEGDPYRAGAGETSNRTFLRSHDRRFQTKEMEPQATYDSREERDWGGGLHHAHMTSSHSSGGGSYLSEQQSADYQSSGRPSNSYQSPSGRPSAGYHSEHVNSVYPSASHLDNSYPSSSHPTKSYLSSGRHENTYPSSGHSDSTYSSSGHSSTAYPSSGHPGNRYSSPEYSDSGHPQSGRSNSRPTGHLSCAPQENGFREEPPPHVPHGRHAQTSGSHQTHPNGLQAAGSRDFWRSTKPHPPPDHTHGTSRSMHDSYHGTQSPQPGPRPLHSENSNFRPDSTSYRSEGSKYRPDASNYRTHSSNYRTGQEGSGFRSEGSGYGSEGYWRKENNVGASRERVLPPVTKPQPSVANWEGVGDPRFHSHQRRGSDSVPRKNYSTTEERRHSFLSRDRTGGPYSPSLSSQSSWSPGGVEESGSPRLRMPLLPSPSTSDDHHGTSDGTTASHPTANGPTVQDLQLHNAKSHGSRVHGSSASHAPPPGVKDSERVREAAGGFKLPPEGGNPPRMDITGGKMRRERKIVQLRDPAGYYERRVPAIIRGQELVSDGNRAMRDPRQLGYGAAASRLAYRHGRRTLQEHAYSRQYQDGCDHYPLFRMVGPQNELSSRLLTPLRSSATTRTQAARQASSSGGSATTPPASATPASATPSPTISRSKQEPSHPKKIVSCLSSRHRSSSATSSGETADPSTTQAVSPSSCTAKERASVQAKLEKKEEEDKEKRGSMETHSSVSRGRVEGGGNRIVWEAVGNSKGVQGKGKTPKSLSVEMGGLEGGRSAEVVDGKARVWSEEDEEDKKAGAASDALEPACSLDGFHLDLDLEPTSNSNSTCCSESEEMAEEKEKAGDSEEEEGDAGGEEPMDMDESCSSSEESLVVSLPNGGLDERGSPEDKQKWLVSLPEPGKMRFSRLDNLDSSSESERLSLKQMTSNRIRLRNGRVLPPSSLAFLTSQKNHSPLQKPSTRTESSFKTPPPPPPAQPSAGSSSTTSPKQSCLRRSKRLAGVTEEGARKEASRDSSEAREDQPLELQLSDEPPDSSDESEFDMPEFDPVPFKPAPSPPDSPYRPPDEGRMTRGKRGRGVGRGRARGGRRGARRGTRNSTRGSDDRSVPSGHGGVQYYMHEPRTREEEEILQRRQAMELEIKMNERLQQSEQLSSAASQSVENSRAAEEGGEDSVSVRSGSVRSGSVRSGSVQATGSVGSAGSLFSLQGSSKSSSLTRDFSPDLIARVKKISTARSSGDTPLHKCCRTGKFDMVRYLLLVENAPVNVQDNAGWTPIHEATSNGQTDIAELLLLHGADSNACSRDGTRPIHDAIEIGSMELVKLLISHRADLMVEYGERTAVEFAMDQDQLEIADYLKEVIRVRSNSKASTAATTRNSAHSKTTPTRHSRKDKMLRQLAKHTPQIPVNGYGPDCVSFGDELDFPLFFVSPIVELSSEPHLPVFNFQISPPGTHNPRRHNFYLMDDLLTALQLEESEFIEKCHEVNILELTVAEFLHRMKTLYYNEQTPIPERIKSLPRKTPVKFVPLCAMLSQMLDIDVENMDN